MWPYWLMFLIPAWAVLMPGRLKPAQAWVPWAGVFLLFALMMGLRHEVGGDWFAYLPHFLDVGFLTAWDVLGGNDPGYYLVNWLVSRAGGMAIVAAALALNRDSSILDLVSFAWAGFGAAFGPIVLLSLYWRKLTSTGALAGMLTGAVTVFVWGNIDVLSSAMYEIVPGFVLNLVVAVLVSRATYKHNATIEEEFTAMENEIEENAPYVVS